MPLYIRDNRVDELAVEVMKAIGAKSKTDAVREALLAKLEITRDKIPLHERLVPVFEGYEKLGCESPGFDMKRFTDDMWGDE